MKTSILLVLLSFLSNQLISQELKFGGGTTIIVEVGHDSIILAGDTRRLVRNTNIGVSNSVTISDKIHQNNSLFYAFSGLTDVTLGDTEIFNLNNVFKSAVKPTAKKFKKSFSAFNKSLEIALKEAFNKDPVKMRRLLNTELIQFVIVSYKKRKPKFEVLHFKLTGTAPAELELQVKKVELRVPFTYTLGLQDHINEYIKNPLLPPNAANAEDRLKYLICLEAKYHNHMVAAPIDLYVIYKNGSSKKTRLMTCE